MEITVPERGDIGLKTGLIGKVKPEDVVYVYRNTMDRDTALIEAGATRLRPIMMTTLTTILSMIPMAMAIGSSGEMTRGLAIVNIGGLTASTLLSLLLLPVYYSIVSRTSEQDKERSERKLKKSRKRWLKGGKNKNEND